MALFDRRKDRRWRDQVEQLIARDPVWGLYLFGRSWLCPYCGKIGVENGRGQPNLPDRAFEHLKACPEWNEFKGVPRPYEELASFIQKTEFTHYLTEQMKTNPLWRLRDSQGVWYCPFCAKPTKVVFQGKRLTRETIDAIGVHLADCYGYDGGHGQPQTLQYLRTIVGNTERTRRLVPEVQSKMGADPLWKFKDKRDRWACPYCKCIVEGVDLSTELLVRSVAPKQAAKHLVESCPAYQDGAPPSATVEELQHLTAGERQEAGVVTSAGTNDTTMVTAIRSELDEMRTMLRESRQSDERQKDLLRSLEEAGKQQRQMLPEKPQIPGFEFEVLYRPMVTVSGDFYDFVQVSPNEIGLVVGDVSGHGMEAALVMSMVKKSLKIHGRGCSSAAEVLRVTNADIHEDLTENTFCSAFYGVLNTEARTLRFVRAGHNPLLLYNPRREPAFHALEPKGIIVGIDKGPLFNKVLEEMELQLASGDMLVQFTDGVTEANNPQKEEFGIERLR